MAEKKSILEEALLDIKNIESALNANTREILRSVAREEIDSVVKESLNEIYEEEDLETTDAVDLGGDADAASADIETELGGDESEMSGLDDIQGSEEVSPSMKPEMGSEMGSKLGMDAPALDGEELDMTTASDDDVIAIYKKLTGEDEIEIVGDEIHLSVSQPGEYVIKTSQINSGTSVAPSMEPEMGDDLGPEMDLDDEGGVDYEIEIGGEEEEEGEAPSDLEPLDDEEGEDSEYEAGEEEEEEEIEAIDEAIPVSSGQAHRMPYKADLGQPKGAGADNLKESARALTETKKKYNNLLTEAKKLKSENEEFRKALKEFRKKLVETVVVNSNLSYMTRLVTEHTTSKAEKLNIIKRFDDEVTNLNESKRLYRTIVNELEGRKPIYESIDKKLIKEVSTGSSKKLTESTAYVDPSTKRILDLIKRVEQK